MKSSITWIVLLAVQFLLLFGGVHGKPRSAETSALLTITFRLVDAETYAPVSGGQLRVTDEKTQQVLPVEYDSISRRFSVSVLPGTSLNSLASASGYLSTRMRLSNLNSVQELTIKLIKPKPSKLVVKVFATTIRQPLASAVVVMTSRITGKKEQFTLPAGRLERTFTEPDDLDIQVSADGYTSVSRRLMIDVPPSGKLVEFDAELDKRTLGLVIWAIDNRTNKVVPEARFTLINPGGMSPVTLNAGSEAGQVTAKLTEKGTYQLTTRASGYEESIRAVAIENEQNPVMVRLIAKPPVMDVQPLAISSRLKSMGLNKSGPPALALSSVKPTAFVDLETGKRIQLNRIYFDQSSPVLRPESYAELDELAAALTLHSSLQIEIRGHTDNQGDFELNTKLSRDRCQSVIDYLIRKGVEKSRLKAVGRGPLDPLAPNNNEENRKKNRRVEFVVL